MTVFRLDKIVADSDMSTNSRGLLVDMLYLAVERPKQQDCYYDTAGSKLPREAQRP
jgi:hypothetical protein